MGVPLVALVLWAMLVWFLAGGQKESAERKYRNK